MEHRRISVLLPNIRSLHNVGSIFRTADGAGVEKLYLTGYTGTPPDKRIEKVSLGAEAVVPWEHVPDTVELLHTLRKQGYQIVALEQTKRSVVYTQFKPTFPLAVVLGHEVDGVLQELLELCDTHVHLPMNGSKNSLNVSVAWGILAYYLSFST